MLGLSREFLSALGVPDAAITPICERHTEITSSLNDKIEKWKKDYEAAKVEADKVPGLQQQVDSLKGGEDYKAKYDKEHEDFEAFKADLAKKEDAKKVEAAFRKLLADEHIKADRHDFIVAHTDLSKATLDKDGNLKEAETFKNEINDNVNGWGAFKVITEQRRASVATPPDNGGAGTGVSRARELYQKHLQQQGVKVEDAGKE